MVSNPAEISLKSLTVPTLAEVFTQFIDNTLLRDDKGVVFSYSNVLSIAQTLAFQATRRRLVMCIINNDIGGIAGYLALLVANAVPMMISSTISENALKGLIDAYQPDYVWLPHEDADRWPTAESKEINSGYALIRLSRDASTPDLHENLALLLSTSGSTGSGKYVRLSHQNIWSNAKSIANYLSLNSDELAITTLPPSYSYGLSIIHSHLCIGAGLAVIDKSLFEREFWNFMGTTKATSFAGVPYHYEILKKLRFERMELPHLRTLTQAGGFMRPELTKEFANLCRIKGMRFFTMYGQTEASPRMSFVTAEQAFTKAGTIGCPIPRGAK
jgi:long-chain acyl-CoA synthetase